MKSVRQSVVMALYNTDKKGTWSQQALNDVLKNSGFETRDKQFATVMFYGTLNHKYTIDKIISNYIKTPINKVDSVVLEILRTGIYSLVYMDSVPDHAAVNEAVNLTKSIGKKSASGFVNGVLRAFLRDGKPVVDTNKKIDLCEAMALEYSCPPRLIKKLIEEFDEKTLREMLSASLEVPPIFIRVNTIKTTKEELKEKFAKLEIVTEDFDLPPNCLKTSNGKVYDTDEYRDGLYYIQDLSSQMTALLVDVRPDMKILDCCGAPGGKAFIMAMETGKSGSVCVCDIYEHRLKEVVRRAAQLGLENISTRVLDMTEYHLELGEFDRVLCDVPCSGYGVIRRRPEIKYKNPDDFKEIADLQLKILKNGAKYCKKGGILVYSTCTIFSDENKKVVEGFLSENNNFQSKKEFVQFPIGKDGGDGFFIAVLEKIK